MFAFIDAPGILPPQASEFAVTYDYLFWYTMAVVIAGGGVVYALLIYCCFVFARKPGVPSQRILGSTKLEFIWTIIPLLFFLSFFVWGIRVWNTAINPSNDKSNPDRNAVDNEYFVVGKQWMWKVQHPSGHREINELHIPVDKDLKMTGTSEDVIHDFGIPAFRSKFDVVPGRYTSAWYRPTKPGTYHIFCDQYCGQGHSQMVGKVHVLSRDDYEKWLEGTYRIRDGKGPVDGSPAWEGRKLFLKLNCVNCHNRESEARAPSLEAIWNTTRTLEGGRKATANRDYIYKAIRQPKDDVRDGWKAIMPAFGKDQVTEEEMNNLISYIKSLKPGDLPSRMEAYPAPLGAPVVEPSKGGN